MNVPLEVILMSNPKLFYSLKILIVIIGLVSIFLTINFYKCKWLKIVFIFLGISGLFALLLFLLSGSICVFGFFGSVGLVLTLHCLVLKQVKNDLRCKGSSICPKPCPPCPPFPPCPKPCPPCLKPCEDPSSTLCCPKDKCEKEKKYCKEEKCENNKQIKKMNEVKFIESSEKNNCGSKYNKYYYKKSFYDYKCKNKYCKKCYNYSSNYNKKDCCKSSYNEICPEIINEIYRY